MRFKGIPALALCVLAAVPARALEERLTFLAGSSAVPAAPARAVGTWFASGAALRRGFKGALDYVVADQVYASDPSVDLLLHFDAPAESDETGNWALSAGPAFTIDASRARLGDGAGSFRGPGSALTLSPRPSSVFYRNSSFRDFTIEFWLYPANADNGEVVLLWRSLRRVPAGVLPQQLSCVVSAGRLAWSFEGFFGTANAASSIELRGRAPLVPRTWSHHLLRFDGDTGLVEYLIDGRPEAEAYATSTGREGGTVYEPAIGAAAPFVFCPDYSGLADELRLSRGFVETPSLRPLGQDPAIVVSPVADFGYGHSRLEDVEAEFKAPGNSSVELSYRISDSWASWKPDTPAWIPIRAGEALPDSARGRYAQVRAELFPDGSGSLSPSLSSITLRFLPDPPPPPPDRLLAVPKDGAVELRWTKVPEADVAGYLVYYGERPGEYFGTDAEQGPSPVDAGDTTTIALTGIPNGKLLYFVVAAYDAAPDPDAETLGARAGGDPSGRERATSRAGEFSPETSARPSRTAR
jgi:hypothetical protein